MCLQGFYKQGSDGIVPISDKVLKIRGTFRGTRRARVNTALLAIIMLRLTSLHAEGSAASIVHEAMKPYFQLRPGSLQLFDIPFNCKTVKDLDSHQARIRRLIKQLKQQVLFCINVGSG